MSISMPSSMNSLGPMGFMKPTLAYFFFARCISERLIVVLPQC